MALQISISRHLADGTMITVMTENHANKAITEFNALVQEYADKAETFAKTIGHYKMNGELVVNEREISANEIPSVPPIVEPKVVPGPSIQSAPVISNAVDPSNIDPPALTGTTPSSSIFGGNETPPVGVVDGGAVE